MILCASIKILFTQRDQHSDNKNLIEDLNIPLNVTQVFV